MVAMHAIIVFQRLQIRYNNIVCLLHGITSFILLNQQSSKFTLHHYDITIFYKRDHHLLYPAFFGM